MLDFSVHRPDAARAKVDCLAVVVDKIRNGTWDEFDVWILFYGYPGVIHSLLKARLETE